MKSSWLASLILSSLLLSACAGATQSAIQTGAAQTLDAELAAAQAEAALQTAEAENAALQATNDALSTANALAEVQPTQTQAPVFTVTAQASPTRTLPPATLGPTHEPGISARFEAKKTCNGIPYAIVQVRNLGSETYQSAIVKLSDSNGDEIRRSDGNNEFLPNSTCPGNEQPTLGPGQERYVSVSLQGVGSGDTVGIRVTVCTEKGYGGNCWSSTTAFVN
ncbi:MAG: hypothetical protein M1347_00015 [Chloroflexi bacterium]|nr:hypothetical protein [Chloroflexota bacterium]